MDPLRTESYEKLWPTPPTVAVLLSALWMGPAGPGASWGSIVSPGPSLMWWTWDCWVLLS